MDNRKNHQAFKATNVAEATNVADAVHRFYCIVFSIIYMVVYQFLCL
jgi:hypothetical protein